MVERELRRGGAAQRMADKRETVPFELAREFERIRREDRNAIIALVRGRVGLAGAAIVDRDRRVAIGWERLLHLFPDACRRLEAVDEEDSILPLTVRKIFKADIRKLHKRHLYAPLGMRKSMIYADR